jgi:hypothetical protein
MELLKQQVVLAICEPRDEAVAVESWSRSTEVP